MDYHWDKEKLVRVWKSRQMTSRTKSLKDTVDQFLRRQVIPRRKKLSRIAEAWNNLLPEELLKHSCLDRFSRGTLYVRVDSAVHLSELNILIKEGLLEQIRQMCPSLSISKIKLTYGYWYNTDESGDSIPIFD